MERLRGTVKDLSGEGWGVVSHANGNTYFVRGAWPGDEVSFDVLSQDKKYAEAVIRDLISAGPGRRTEVPCPYQGYELGKCGGCPWMMATYESQLEYKQKRLKYLLDRFKFPSGEEVLKKIWPSPRDFAFRNRAQFKTDGKKLGFVSPQSQCLVDVEKCLVLNEAMAQNLQTLRDQLPTEYWEPGPKHPWNFIDSDDQETRNFPINQRRPFRQGNTEQNEKMRQWLSEHCQRLRSQGTFVELYAGSGNFTRVLAQHFSGKICAIEVASAPLEELRKADLPKLEVLEADLSNKTAFKNLPRSLSQSMRYLLLDPPREGALGLEELTGQAPKLETVFYISCDVRTWTRDLNKLSMQFELCEVQPVDQFPHTPHVEILSVLRRREAT